MECVKTMVPVGHASEDHCTMMVQRALCKQVSPCRHASPITGSAPPVGEGDRRGQEGGAVVHQVGHAGIA